MQGAGPSHAFRAVLLDITPNRGQYQPPRRHWSPDTQVWGLIMGCRQQRQAKCMATSYWRGQGRPEGRIMTIQGNNCQGHGSGPNPRLTGVGPTFFMLSRSGGIIPISVPSNHATQVKQVFCHTHLMWNTHLSCTSVTNHANVPNGEPETIAGSRVPIYPDFPSQSFALFWCRNRM
jgi:hypothetical protein